MDPLTPEQWRRIRPILDRVLEAPSAERPALFEALCAGDPGLRADIAALLAAEGRANQLFEAPVAEVAGALISELAETAGQEPVPGSMAGQRVGAYRLVREIARGGMGTVYLAERADGQFDQQVAVKLLRRDLEGDDRLHRFLAERQILASLSHPNIARVVDGGTTEDGRPYLVMEYVEGSSITEYGDANRLSIDDRLRLFSVVADAVQHAHRSLIVHRDIKPSNIMVTGDRQVKLLDFGIAKLLAADDASHAGPRTRTGLRLMTPEYASPEQVRGEPVTTASDVYQLGLLLYELLAGRRAQRLDGLSALEAERLIYEREPPAPSTAATTTDAPGAPGPPDEPTPARIAASRRTVPERLARTLRGDLDAIVLKALRKEPEHRYPTAEAMVDDIRRHLAGLPVRARRGTRRYRARKFGRRHRWAITGAMTIALLLVGYAGTATVQAGQVRGALEQARLEAAKARQVTDFLIGMFESGEPGRTLGQEVTARQILSRAVESAELLADQPEVQAEMLAVTGRVYRSLGEYEQARPLLERALSLRRSLHGDRHVDVASSMNALATLLQHQGLYDDAEPLFRDALETRRSLLGAEHEDVASSLNNLALVLHMKGDLDEAEPLFREALALQRRLDGEDLGAVATKLQNLGILLMHKGDLDGAEPLMREALQLYRAAYGDEHPMVALGLDNLALVLQDRGEYDAAADLSREGLAMTRRMLGEDHPEVSISMHNLATLLGHTGDYEGAASLFVEVTDRDRRQLGEAHPDRVAPLLGLGGVHLAQDRPGDAEAPLREALAIAAAALQPGHWRIALVETQLGRCLAALGRDEEAEPLLLRGFTSLHDSFGVDHPQTRRALDALIEFYDGRGREEEAAEYRGRAR